MWGSCLQGVGCDDPHPLRQGLLFSPVKLQLSSLAAAPAQRVRSINRLRCALDALGVLFGMDFEAKARHIGGCVRFASDWERIRCEGMIIGALRQAYGAGRVSAEDDYLPLRAILHSVADRLNDLYLHGIPANGGTADNKDAVLG